VEHGRFLAGRGSPRQKDFHAACRLIAGSPKPPTFRRREGSVTTTGAGIDASLSAAILKVFRRGVAVGHADDSFTSLIEIFKKTAA
jgi:hypothetical protein